MGDQKMPYFSWRRCPRATERLIDSAYIHTLRRCIIQSESTYQHKQLTEANEDRRNPTRRIARLQFLPPICLKVAAVIFVVGAKVAKGLHWDAILFVRFNGGPV